MFALLRTSLVVGLLAGMTLLVYWQVSNDADQQRIEELKALNTEMQERLDQHVDMVDRLSRSRRIAHIQVLDQRKDGDRIETDILFIELDDAGSELGRQKLTLPGAYAYVDAWTIKFNHADVAQGHPYMGKSLVLLRQVFTENTPPIEGIPLDTPGAIPPGYAASDASRFEKQLWDSFWQLAADPDMAASMNVRVAQGDIVYKPLKVGEVYELTADATGGLSLIPLRPTDLYQALSDGGDGRPQ